MKLRLVDKIWLSSEVTIVSKQPAIDVKLLVMKLVLTESDS